MDLHKKISEPQNINALPRNSNASGNSSRKTGWVWGKYDRAPYSMSKELFTVIGEKQADSTEISAIYMLLCLKRFKLFIT